MAFIAALGALRAHSRLLLCFDANDPGGAICDLHVTAVPSNTARGAALCLWGPDFALVPKPSCVGGKGERRGVLFAFGAADPAELRSAARWPSTIASVESPPTASW